MNIADLAYTPKEVRKRFQLVYSRAMNEIENFHKGNFEWIYVSDLAKLFKLYDDIFFEGYFLREHGEKIEFNLSSRMTSNGGKVETRKDKKKFRITLSAFLLFKTFQVVKREITVNGLTCHNRLQAAMRILEHEIVHLLELLHFGESSCKALRFRQISKRLFLHTDVTHRLVTQKEVAHRKFNLHVGDDVTFEFEGRTYSGMINRINKRATVMVQDSKGSYSDKEGNKYLKFYVPMGLLKPAVTENQKKR